MTDRTGQQFGNYRLLRQLGRGGFSDVYLGEHLYLNTKAAIKILHTRLLSDDLPGFLQEARIIANLAHPHIIRVLDFGVQDEIPFLVMDYAQNGSLRQRYPKGSRLSLPTLLPFVKQVAEALQYAHDLKLVHRDVKPENMLLNQRYEVMLSDFGIALVAQTSSHQATQEVVGTVSYMAPEQLQGKPRAASDQYALAIVVYEWLTGAIPFHGTFTEVASQHLFTPPPPLRERLPHISLAVEQVMQIALAKDFRQRFMSVQAFARALEQADQATDDAPTFITPVSPIPPVNAPEPISQSGLERSSLPAVAPTTPIVSGPYSLTSLPPPPPPPIQSLPAFSAQTPSSASQAVTDTPPTRRGVSRRTLLIGVAGGVIAGSGIALLALTHALGGAGTGNSVQHPSPTHTQPGKQPSQTGSAASATPTQAGVVQPVGYTYTVYTGHSDQVAEVAWAPRDQTRIASCSFDQTVQIWNAGSGTDILTHSQSSQVYTLAWSPSGSTIVSGGEDASAQIWGSSANNQILTYTNHNKAIYSLAWSPDGRYIVSASGDFTAQVWDAASGSTQTTYANHTNTVWAVAWSPDGRLVASASFDGSVNIWEALTGSLVQRHSDPAGMPLRGVSWSSDGRLIASGGDSAVVEVWDVHSGNVLYTYHGHRDHIESVHWSPVSGRIASASKDGTVRIWDATTGNHDFVYQQHTQLVWSIAWSPDGQRLASASQDRTVRVWQAV